MPAIAKGLHLLKALFDWIHKGLSLWKTWFMARIVGVIVGIALGIMVAKPKVRTGEMELMGSIVLMNCFLVMWSTTPFKQKITFLPEKTKLMVLMMIGNVLFLSSHFLALLGIKIGPCLFERLIPRDWFWKQPLIQKKMTRSRRPSILSKRRKRNGSEDWQLHCVWWHVCQ